MQIDFNKIKVVPDNQNNKYLLYYNEELIGVPKSIAIILDGNGRYATKNNLPRALGHKAGCEALEEILEETVKLGIKYLTVYAFSTENWKRSKEEINSLFELFFLYLSKIEDNAIKNNVKVSFIGDIQKFPNNLYNECIRLMEHTKNNDRCVFSIALNLISCELVIIFTSNI